MRIEFVKNNIPGIPINVSGELKKTKELGYCSFHIHDDIEILLAVSGAMRVDVEGQNITISEGDICIINPRVPHSTTELLPYTSVILLQFRIDKLRALEFGKINKYLSFILNQHADKYVFLKSSDSVTASLNNIITLIHSENILRQKNYDVIIKGYTEILLGLLYRNNILNDIENNYNAEAVKKVWQAIEYIDKNYRSSITLSELSALIHLNSEYFCRLFKSATGITPMQYINYVRIWKAENLLTTTDLDILEISMEVGFSSVSYFNRVFKKFKNTTPSVYKGIRFEKDKLM